MERYAPSAGAGGIDLTRPRDLGQILSACFELYGRHFWTFAAIAFTVVIPIDLVVDGIAAGWLFSDRPEFLAYDESPPLLASLADGAADLLVTTPLITAGHVHAVMDIGAGREPSARRSLVAAGRMLLPVAGAVVLFVFGSVFGLVALIVPGVYLFVSWYVAPQAVVVLGQGPVDALGHSHSLVSGSWWRVFGIVVVLTLIASVALGILAVPLDLAADAADSGALSLLGLVLSDGVTLSFLALSGTILFFDLGARRSARPAEG